MIICLLIDINLQGKSHELREELHETYKKDKSHARKTAVLKRIIANTTMGQDMLPLFNDIIVCMQLPVIEIKKMCFLYILNYARHVYNNIYVFADY